MIKLLTAIACLFYLTSAFADAEIETLNQNIENYLTEQNKTPKQLINYKNSNGNLLKALLSEEHSDLVAKTVTDKSIDIQIRRTTSKKLNDIINSYNLAFNQQPNEYDEEHFEANELRFKLMLCSAKNPEFFSLPNATPQQKEQLTALLKLTPPIQLARIKKEITEGKYSKEFTPIAESRLKQLESLALELKDTSQTEH